MTDILEGQNRENAKFLWFIIHSINITLLYDQFI